MSRMCFSLSKILRLIVLGAMLMGAVGCSAENTAQDTSPLRVEWTFWEGDYTIIVAQSLGLFEKYGVKVQPVYYSNFSEVVPDLVSGKLDGGLLGMIDLMNASGRTDMKAVAVYDSGGTLNLATKTDIRSPVELKGKRIGVGVGTSGEMVVREILRQGKLTSRDVILVNVPPENALKEFPENVDAVVVYEPYTTQVLQKGATLLSAAEASALLPDVIVFRASVVQQNPEKIKAFLQAWFEAVEYRKTHEEYTRGVIAAALSVPPGDVTFGDVQVYGLEDNLRLFGPVTGQEMSSIYNVGQINMDFLVSTGSLTTLMDLRKIFDPSFLPTGASTGFLPAPVAALPGFGEANLP
jgi:NitT/TauT family transport system substrate-binding protein